MRKYDPKIIEPKWQKIWEDTKLYQANEKSAQDKAYVLDFFPYPSGAGLSVGHARNYTMSDVYPRFKRMQGFNVLHPMGWDAFGLPAENYAIKNKVSPREATDKNKANYKRQMQMLGLSYDWDREIDSTDPNYYRWTQWFFLLLHKRGLAYQADSLQWWCDTDKTVLANEQVEAGKCWRCGNTVTKKKLKQWFFRITEYADRLINDLDGLDWPEGIKQQQRNWIGKSEGAEIQFQIPDSDLKIQVFSTRPDTLAGATFLVLAPEHPLVSELTTKNQKSIVQTYLKKVQSESELERQETDRPKTGVDTGATAINPLTGKEIPVWTSDYVLLGYGTGAIMAVPAHDQRDEAFAKKFKLPIKPVGTADWKSHSTPKISYKLRDWLISRQRYWGAPIPIVHCSEDGAVPVPEEDLPVELPELKSYEHSSDGRSPLASVDSFVNTRCPKCGGPARRETDTLDGFACSSWYFLRFASPNETEHAFNKEAVKYWLPVDMYIGGAEHAVMHLLYARFWTKVMYDAKLVDFSEPFKALRNQGMILAGDGRKMSKSLGNVITPDEVIEQVGADALRLYEMFIAPYNQEVTWSQQGLTGTYRFLSRVWTLTNEFSDSKQKTTNANLETALVSITHKTIKKATNDIEDFGFNTAVSTLMEFVNELYKIKVDLPPSAQNQAWTEAIGTLLKLLAPFAPHITEELWQQIGGEGSIHISQWPHYREELVKEDLVEVVVQVNGKLRATITITPDTDDNAMEKSAKQHEAVSKHLAGKKIIKTITVPRKIVNFVTD